MLSFTLHTICWAYCMYMAHTEDHVCAGQFFSVLASPQCPPPSPLTLYFSIFSSICCSSLRTFLSFYLSLPAVACATSSYLCFPMSSNPINWIISFRCYLIFGLLGRMDLSACFYWWRLLAQHTKRILTSKMRKMVRTNDRK